MKIKQAAWPSLTSEPPPKIEVSGADLTAKLAEVEANGGHVEGMERVTGHNAR